MAAHNVFGKEGEDIATEYLINHGYTILNRNWRWRHKEIDIIAKVNNELVIIEVKSRRNNLYGNPEEAVNNKKIKRIVSSTDAYIKKYAIDMDVRFDIIAVTGENHPYVIEHIIDAFHASIE